MNIDVTETARELAFNDYLRDEVVYRSKQEVEWGIELALPRGYASKRAIAAAVPAYYAHRRALDGYNAAEEKRRNDAMMLRGLIDKLRYYDRVDLKLAISVADGNTQLAERALAALTRS